MLSIILEGDGFTNILVSSANFIAIDLNGQGLLTVIED
jgi:hypothetical protein